MARRSEGLSKRHKKILKFLAEFQEENGYSPSIREIGESIGVRSTSLVDIISNSLKERTTFRENSIFHAASACSVRWKGRKALRSASPKAYAGRAAPLMTC